MATLSRNLNKEISAFQVQDRDDFDFGKVRQVAPIQMQPEERSSFSSSAPAPQKVAADDPFLDDDQFEEF
jgi:hypothetical protein